MFHATLQQLRLFAAVARHQSFTRAAEELHLTQPAVSIQVKRLEEQVGLPLFEQIGKRIYLTQAGQELYGACRDVFERLDALSTTLDEQRGEVAGPLRLAAVTTAKYFLPYYLGDFLRRYPRVEPHLKVTNRANVLDRLNNNVDDIYILGLLPEDQELVTQPFLEDELVMFASPDHPLAGRKAIPFEEVARERLLFREQGSGIRLVLEQYFKEHNLTVTPYMDLGSGEAIKQGVMAGIGIGMLSTFSLRLELGTGHLVALDVEGLPIRRHWHAVHPKGKRLSLVAQRFWDFLLTDQPLARGIQGGDGKRAAG